MDAIREMYNACEAMVFSTDKSRARYMQRLNELERKFDIDLSKFEEIANLSDDIMAKVEKIEDAKEREKAIKKEVGQIVKFCQRNYIYELEPLDLIKVHKRVLSNAFNRADRKNPDVQKRVDEINAMLSEGGKLYKKAQAMHDRIFGNDAGTKAHDTHKRNQQAAAAHMQMMQQQQILQQQMQMQIHQEMVMQANMMHQQQMAMAMM